MTPFKLHILGCGSALPTLHHNCSSQVIEIRNKMFMIDCGEGTQMQLRRKHLGFTKINNVFISHLHGDHCFGLIGMISTFGMLGRTSPLNIYAHSALNTILNAQLDMFCRGIGYDIIFHPVDTEQHNIIYEDRSVTVETIPLEHRIPCCGFLFREKPTLPHIRRDKIDYYNIPNSEINNIKNKQDWHSPDNRIIPWQELTRKADEPASYAYCSDTRYIPELFKLIKDVNTLYHESTYASRHETYAIKYWHSTAKQAALVAREAHVERLLLGHFSSRYENENELLNEAREIFPNTFLADENITFDIRKGIDAK